MLTVNVNKKGYIALIAVMILTGLILVIVLSLTNILIFKKNMSKNLIYSAQSYYSSESALEDGIVRVLNGYSYGGLNNFGLDGSLITLSINTAGDTTTIESVSDNANNLRKVRATLTITDDDLAFHYGVQVGPGGLVMGNNSQIDGNIYSDGSITGGSGAEITGDVFVATGMSLDRSYAVYNGDGVFGKKNTSVIDIAQSFVPTVSANLSQVSLYIRKNGTPSDKTIRIVTDNAGSPSTTVLQTTPLSVSKIGNSYGWVDFAFSTPPALNAGTTYWIVVDATDDSTTKYFEIGKDLAKGNVNDVSKYSADWSAGGWTEDSGDFDYKVWMGGLSTSLNSIDVGGSAHAHEITDCDIDGDAYYQVISGSTVAGTSYPGSADPPVEALPISDSNITDWKSDANAINPALPLSLCTQPVSVTISGGVLDCDFAPANGITITLNGTLWVKGDVTLGVGTKLILGTGYGTKSGIILADKPGSEPTSGKILTDNNVVICGSQGLLDANTCNPSIGSYILMLSTHSGAATYAVDVRNNTNGAIFYAHQGTAHINNGANLKEVTAYRLELAPTAVVTYESGLASASFTSGPGGGWVIGDWNEFQ